MMFNNVKAVLFDLDGTLLDSAPDLYAALLAQCAEEGVAAPPYAPVREVVSRGARAVLRCAFAERGEPALEALVPRYLQLYQGVMARQTVAFDGVDDLPVGRLPQQRNHAPAVFHGMSLLARAGLNPAPSYRAGRLPVIRRGGSRRSRGA